MEMVFLKRDETKLSNTSLLDSGSSLQGHGHLEAATIKLKILFVIYCLPMNDCSL